MSATEPRRRVPSVDALLRGEPGKRAARSLGRPVVKLALQRALEEVRAAAAKGTDPPADDEILARALALASDAATGLTPVINATGVVLHTGLGRAPLPEAAARAAARAGAGYSDLEVDRVTGRRGRRTARAELLLRSLTGVEAALVVNNGAAGVLLSLGALAKGKQVLVSRGELIEIGGEFRIPDIMAASGAKLVEVGTTNRTRVRDFKAALTERTAAILKVHPSNYRVVGFTAEPAVADLATVARTAGVPLLYDMGSGLLERWPGVPAEEPSVAEALAQGADLVVFSGDKLLGGPQAGIVLGGEDLVERLRRHPLARALRVDAMQVAALETVLAAHARGRRANLPVWRMLREPADEVRRRAANLAEALDGELEGARVVPCASTVGGGSLPGFEIPSFGVEVRVPDPPAMAARLRIGRPSVFCRVGPSSVLLDVRTVPEDRLADLARAVQYALEGDDVEDA
ncbi:MAG TPA: L-seryl-tRNA(Sec) selenium transferase [Actinomycetota bacterium]|nr:L-seryl-tRNA(Sec) selenium transferase [Actinomycetota bacterium]